MPLQGIAERVDKYIKKTKVRGAGLNKYIGRSHLVSGGENWYEWSIGVSYSKEGCLSNEQGRLWYFVRRQGIPICVLRFFFARELLGNKF